MCVCVFVCVFLYVHGEMKLRPLLTPPSFFFPPFFLSHPRTAPIFLVQGLRGECSGHHCRQFPDKSGEKTGTQPPQKKRPHHIG